MPEVVKKLEEAFAMDCTVSEACLSRESQGRPITTDRKEQRMSWQLLRSLDKTPVEAPGARRL
jgi:hypothetical protein